MTINAIDSSLEFIKNLRNAQKLEAEEAQQNPYLMEALEREKYEGHRLAVFARTVALGTLAVLVPILVPDVNAGVIFHHYPE